MSDYNDPMRSIAREMAIAERKRQATVRLSVFVGSLAVAGLALIVGAIAAGKPSESKNAAPQTAEPILADAPVESAPEPEPKPVPDPQVDAAAQNAAPDPEPKPEPAPQPKPKPKPSVQRASIKIGSLGYEPATLELKAGAPIELTVAKGEGCAAGFALPELGVSADNTSGPATVKLGPLKPGTYTFTCGMAMVEGRLVIS